MTTMKSLQLVLLYTFVLNYLSEYQLSFISAYTLTPSQSLKDGQILTSQSETFELGFFSPPNSKTRYLGIWYKKIPVQTVVWVANRVSPLNDTLGELLLSAAGHLVILSRPNHVIWSTNSSKIAENPIVEFLQSGNLVLRNRNSDEPLWQSFDYPSDTLLPDMKLGRDLRSGLNRYLRSWKSVDDPSLGDYTYGFEISGDPEGFIKNGSNKYYRAGPWNGLRGSGSPDAKNNSIFKYEIVINENDFYYRYQLVNQAVTSRLILIQTGNEGFLKRFTWVDQRQSWVLHVPIPRDRCDHYGICGPGSICDISNNPVCHCLKGFSPRSPHDYKEMDWSKGCKRETPLHCDQKVGFEKFVEVKLPDTMHTWRNTSMSLEECRVECIKNCSCTAYANADIRGDGSGCVMWFGYLIDIRKVSGAGQDLYIRMSASELEADVPKETRKDIERNKAKKIIVTISGISSVLLLGALLCFIWRKKITQRIHKLSSNQIVQKEKIKSAPFHKVFKHGKRDQPGEKNEDLELNIFDLETIVRATCNFSSINMLGQGGYGCVYKGTLKDGQEIAVKRLSKNSRQGVKEFKNEVILIARLQHRNLVRLLGLCIEGEEKILVYEYLENKGLDAMLFDKTFNFILDWPKRVNIIAGISRGLLYLHRDSRFRIIHRDLKTSNVLLDGKLNPKISDFGMARIFGGDDTEAETRRVMGTYGYMPPEYAMDGIFSIKSDVFSFGVLLLEIISGKKNRGLFCSDNKVNLLGHAWKLWKERRALELIDETMKESCIPNEALRCIHIGLLCVQEHAKDRPTMSSVVLMLSTDTTKLEQPRPPGFCFGRSNDTEANSTLSKQESCSANDVTITNLEAR